MSQILREIGECAAVDLVARFFAEALAAAKVD